MLNTVEKDKVDSDCYTSIRSDERVKELLKNRRFHLASNFWMPFHADALERRQTANVDGLRKGCSQVFNNVVITPHDNLSACCGLTLEDRKSTRLNSRH